MSQSNAGIGGAGHLPTISGGGGGGEGPRALKPPVDETTLIHKKFRAGPFWQRIPAYAKISEEQFLDHKWQAKNTITNVPKLLAALQDLVTPEFYQDAEQGFL